MPAGEDTTPLDAAEFADLTGVSRETRATLEAYADLLARWQRRINLIGPRTLPDLWRRHFLDSAQLAPRIPAAATRLVDLGSGAGFPGLVLCILRPDLQGHLIESDHRKAAFLREAARRTGVSDRVSVHAARADSVQGIAADVVTARALAPLVDLMPMAARFLAPDGICLFLKGKRCKEELTAVNYMWHINYQTNPSRTDPEGQILTITDFSPKADPGPV